jgi:hypothetical protein
MAAHRLISAPRILACLVLGLVLSVGTCALLATFLFPSHWYVHKSVHPPSLPPTYLAAIAPELREISVCAPTGPSGNGPIFWGLNVGIDTIRYGYGDSMWDRDFRPWDPIVSPEPSSVELIRYRFGWPMRAVSMDDVTTGGANAGISTVSEFYRRAYQLAGEHRGLNRPAWLPTFVPMDRVPVAVRWGALAVNTVVWAGICYLILIAGGWWLRNRVRARRAERGLCTECRYALEGLAVCPECGTTSGASGGCDASVIPPG